MSSRGLLGRILDSKRAEIAKLRAPVSKHVPGGLVEQTLRRPLGLPLRLIAESKPRSPSAGVLSSALSVTNRALAYAEAGAVMISVLVDEPFFGGSYENLAQCREVLEATYGATRPRLLGKEFILDPIQIDHVAASGADAVLLIARIVTAEELTRLVKHARDRGLEPLVEVTTEVELAMALGAGAKVIGVNARDLDTLVMDQARAAAVLERIDPNVVRVHLSGLSTPEDVARVARGQADAALIGEALMRRDDPRELLRAMVKRSADKP